MTVVHTITVNLFSLSLFFFFFLQLTDKNEYVRMNKYIPILLRLVWFSLVLSCRGCVALLEQQVAAMSQL